MSTNNSGISNKNTNKFKKSNPEFIEIANQKKLFVRVSDLVIPFSNLRKKKQTNDIYTGKEKIHFKERNSEFKTILRKEFSKALKEFGNDYRD